MENKIENGKSNSAICRNLGKDASYITSVKLKTPKKYEYVIQLGKGDFAKGVVKYIEEYNLLYSEFKSAKKEITGSDGWIPFIKKFSETEGITLSNMYKWMNRVIDKGHVVITDKPMVRLNTVLRMKRFIETAKKRI